MKKKELVAKTKNSSSSKVNNFFPKITTVVVSQ